MEYLRNDKLLLRPPEPEDLDSLYRWENDPEIWQLSGTLVPFSKHMLRIYLESAAKDLYEQKQLRLMIEAPGGDSPLGAIDLFNFEPYHRRAGVGILIAEKSERRKGYARVALDLLKNYCFSHLGLHQLWCNISPANEASLKLFSAAGFSICGKKEQWIFNGQTFEDEWLLQAFNPVLPKKESR